MLDLTHSSRIQPQVAPEAPRQFKFLYVLGFLLALPVVAFSRLLPARRGEPRDHESILAETNRSVLTALGTAFMA